MEIKRVDWFYQFDTQDRDAPKPEGLIDRAIFGDEVIVSVKRAADKTNSTKRNGANGNSSRTS